MIALPGTRGGRRSPQRPRVPGYAISAEELTGLRPLHRLVRRRLNNQHECCLPVTAFRVFVRPRPSYLRTPIATVVAWNPYCRLAKLPVVALSLPIRTLPNPSARRTVWR